MYTKLKHSQTKCVKTSFIFKKYSDITFSLIVPTRRCLINSSQVLKFGFQVKTYCSQKQNYHQTMDVCFLDVFNLNFLAKFARSKFMCPFLPYCNRQIQIQNLNRHFIAISILFFFLYYRYNKKRLIMIAKGHIPHKQIIISNHDIISQHLICLTFTPLHT